MSVCIFHDDELRGLRDELIKLGAPRDEAEACLTILHQANILAYCSSYNEPIAQFPMSKDLWTATETRKQNGWTTEAWARNLSRWSVSGREPEPITITGPMNATNRATSLEIIPKILKAKLGCF